MSKNNNVFINCPFDKKYDPLRISMMFTIIYCGFSPRCALEEDNGVNVRVDKIKNLIKDSMLSIHDISRIQLDKKTKLPRFNMPLELGIFLGAKYFGGKIHQKKNCLILDKKEYRYQASMSDISGQDIRAHHNKIHELITHVRNWLIASTKIKRTFAGGNTIFKKYKKFIDQLPIICRKGKTKQSDLTYTEYVYLISKWLKENI